FWRYLVENRRLISILDFENKKRIFPGVHQEQKFCLLSLAGDSRPREAPVRIGFWLTDPSQLTDLDRVYALPLDELNIINPNTSQPPVCRTKRDFSLVSAIQRRNEIM